MSKLIQIFYTLTHFDDDLTVGPFLGYWLNKKLIFLIGFKNSIR